MSKTRYGCYTCGRIGTAKSMRLVDRKQTYGSCLNRTACLARRERRLRVTAEDEIRAAEAESSQ